MKNTALFIMILFLSGSCTKSETQYSDQDNKRQSVNNQQSDTIKTLIEYSDTLQNVNKPTEVKTDNE